MTKNRRHRRGLIERRRREAARKGWRAPYALHEVEAGTIHLGASPHFRADGCTSPESFSKRSPIGSAYTALSFAAISRRFATDGTSRKPPTELHHRTLKEGVYPAYISTCFCVFGILLCPLCRLSAPFCTQRAEPSPTRKSLCEGDFHRGRWSSALLAAALPAGLEQYHQRLEIKRLMSRSELPERPTLPKKPDGFAHPSPQEWFFRGGRVRVRD
jgi:hypothetical protein